MESRNHFVAYHNSDKFGPFYGSGKKRSAKRGEQHTFATAKLFREDTLKGQHLWTFEGSGSPRRYNLISCGIITQIKKWKRPTKNRKVGHSHGTLVHFELETNHTAIDVTDLPWFRKLFRQQQSFRNGFNRIADRSIIRALERLESKSEGGRRVSDRTDQSLAMARVRRSPSAAAQIIRQFVPKRHWKDVLNAVAHSIKIAHAADPAKWGLRLNRNSVMLKVGFVEVMQVGDSWFHQLVKRDLVTAKLRSDRRFRFSIEPYANATTCDACDMDVSSVARAYSALLPAHESAIRVAAQSPRHTSTTKDHSPGLVVFLSQELGMLLPQPSYLENGVDDRARLPEEVAPDEEFEEGAVTQVLVNRYERDLAARKRCIQHYGTSCFVCGMSLANRYGPEIDGLIHVPARRSYLGQATASRHPRLHRSAQPKPKTLQMDQVSRPNTRLGQALLPKDTADIMQRTLDSRD
jgi:hypothetical protein